MGGVTPRGRFFTGWPVFPRGHLRHAVRIFHSVAISYDRGRVWPAGVADNPAGPAASAIQNGAAVCGVSPGDALQASVPQRFRPNLPGPAGGG